VGLLREAEAAAGGADPAKLREAFEAALKRATEGGGPGDGKR